MASRIGGLVPSGPDAIVPPVIAVGVAALLVLGDHNRCKHHVRSYRCMLHVAIFGSYITKFKRIVFCIVRRSTLTFVELLCANCSACRTRPPRTWKALLLGEGEYVVDEACASHRPVPESLLAA